MKREGEREEPLEGSWYVSMEGGKGGGTIGKEVGNERCGVMSGKGEDLMREGVRQWRECRLRKGGK